MISAPTLGKFGMLNDACLWNRTASVGLGIWFIPSFEDLLYLPATRNSEFLHQQELVKKWANMGPEDWCQELSERAQGFVAEGRREIQSTQEPVASEAAIGGEAARNEAMARRRHNGYRE